MLARPFFLVILSLLVAATTLKSQQTFVAESILPTGPTETDANLIQFEATFQVPVVGGDDPAGWTRNGQGFIPAGTFVGSTTLDVRSEFGRLLEHQAPTHVAEVPAGITLPNSFIVEFWYKPTGPLSSKVVFSYAVGSTDNALAFFVDGRVFFDQAMITNVGGSLVSTWRHIAIEEQVA